ncbi:MAG: winged helix-turn-helix transcriptional regulator [Candidatus Hermodarchaeota archaeon]
MKSTKKTNEVEDLKKKYEKIADDPIKIGILLGIARNPNITARELKKTIQLKGTKIYHYLKKFENDGLIYSKFEDIPKKNLKQKRYYVNPDYFGEDFVLGLRAGNLKDFMLFELSLIAGIINSQIHTLLNMDDNEFRKLTEDRVKIISVFGFTGTLSSRVKEKYEAFYKELQEESSSELGKLFSERLQKATHAFFIGYLPFE